MTKNNCVDCDFVNCIWFCAFELDEKQEKEQKMLDLEVIPERSLGCDNWEFILGKYKQRNFDALLLV